MRLCQGSKSSVRQSDPYDIKEFAGFKKFVQRTTPPVSQSNDSQGVLRSFIA
jgi:hypothetical protein